jgi:hypothetical protein
MLYDFMIEEFKKSFNPTFKEQGLDTICYLGEDPIVKKNEADQTYTWLKEYPPELKEFIIEHLEKSLKPKYFLATYNVQTGEIRNQKNELVEASLVTNNHLMNILNFLQVETMSGLLVRKIDDKYEFRPVIEEVDNGFSMNMKKQEVLKFFQKRFPHLLPEVLRSKDEPVK